MRPVFLMAAAGLLAFAGPAVALAADPHAHHHMEAPAADDPHAGHAAPGDDPHAGHRPAPAPVGDAPAPPVPSDHAADRVYPPAEMAAARARLAREHGNVAWSKVSVETAEYGAGDRYAWEARASYGGDLNRVVLKSQGEGGDDLEAAEIQALYTRAVGPYFDLEAGLRQDVQPGPRRTYAVLGVDGVAPYWFELEGAVFLSHKGELSARLEGSYDLRLTQRLVLEPRGEVNFSAEKAPALGRGSGLTTAELGLRLRYAIVPEFAPYVGVVHERSFGSTARYARAAGEDARDTRLVVGLRAWF